MSDYSTTVEMDVRYRDIDSVGHVNNAVYVSYLEQARVSYVRDVLGEKAIDPNIVLVNVDVNYERPIRFGEQVTVGMETTAIGTKSIEMAYEIRADDERAATATTVVVPFDPETSESYPVPETWRDRITAHEGREF